MNNFVDSVADKILSLRNGPDPLDHLMEKLDHVTFGRKNFWKTRILIIKEAHSKGFIKDIKKTVEILRHEMIMDII